MPEQDRFAPRGKVSLRAACEEIIRALPEDEGIRYDEAIAEVSERTGLDDLTLHDVQAAMRAASERLLTAKEPGVRTVMKYGWIRMTPPQVVRHAEERDRRGTRQYLRAGVAAEAADVERLGWEDRQRRETRIEKARRVAELEGRRARRLRPLPPGETA